MCGLALCLQMGMVQGTALAQDDAAAGGASPGLAQLASQFEKTPEAIVAEVNGTAITAGMVASHMRDLSPRMAALPAATIYAHALDDLVQQRSLALKARALGLDQDPWVRRRIEADNDHTLANALIRHILPELVTETAIKNRYDTTVAGRPGPVEVQLRIIATEDEDSANLALAALRRGTAFSEVARVSSIDATRTAGGEVGFAGRDQLTPELAAVAFSLMPGQMSEFPVPSAGKWFIVQVDGRRQQATPSLDSARPGLLAQLEREAAVEIIKVSRSAVVVNDYGPTGKRLKAGAVR